jgi:hypothetical protein
MNNAPILTIIFRESYNTGEIPSRKEKGENEETKKNRFKKKNDLR